MLAACLHVIAPSVDLKQVCLRLRDCKLGPARWLRGDGSCARGEAPAQQCSRTGCGALERGRGRDGRPHRAVHRWQHFSSGECHSLLWAHPSIQQLIIIAQQQSRLCKRAQQRAATSGGLHRRLLRPHGRTEVVFTLSSVVWEQ